MSSTSNIILLKEWTRFGRRRGRAPTTVTAIDIDGQTLRIVQGAPKGQGTAITKVAAVPLVYAPNADRNDAAVVGAAVGRALADAKIKPGGVVMGIPRAQIVLRTLLLPMLNDLPELASMVHMQVARDLPFRMDEAVVDFKVRRQVAAPAPAPVDGKVVDAPAPRLEILVAAVKRDVVEFFRQTAEIAGVKLLALGLLPYANVRCVEACQVAEGNEAFVFVSLRPDEATIDVIAEQTLLFSRSATVQPGHDESIPAGSEPPPNAMSEAARAEAFVELATIEVVRSLHSFSGMEPNTTAARAVVTGASGHEENVVKALAKRLGRPCTLLDPVGALGLTNDSREHAAGAIAAIGLALGVNDPQGLPFDFLNPKKPAVQRDMGRIRLLAGIAAAAALIVFVVALRTYLINQRTRVHKEWTAKVIEAEKNRGVYKRMIQQATVIEDWVGGEKKWLEHYAYLSALLPPSEEVYVTSFGVTGQGAIRFGIQAASGEVLARMDKQLRAAGYEVKPLAITPGADRHGYEFRSNVELSIPAKLKIDLAKVKAPGRPADDVSLELARRKGGGA